MAQVRAKTKCFVDNGIRNEGDVFEYDGPKNTNLEYLKGAPKVSEVEEQAEVEQTAEQVAEQPAEEAPATGKKWTPKAKRASAD